MVVPTEGPPLSTPELAVSTPGGELRGIGSDGGEGVWFAEDTDIHEDANMVHYSPAQVGLTTVPLTLASPFNEVIQGIAPGPKGTEWFARFYDNEISHITARGKLVTKKLPTSSEPQDVAVNQQGAVWFTERGHGCALGRLWPKGKLTTYSPFGADCYDLTIGPDETVWVADYASNQVVEVSGTTGEVIARYNLRLPVGIATLGEDIYVTEDEPGVVAKIAPSGEVTEYLLPAGRKLEWMTAGPDDAVWFDETIGAGVPAIGRLTPSGELREVPVAGGGGGEIAATNDAIYFTDGNGLEAGIMRIPASSSGGGSGGSGAPTVGTPAWWNGECDSGGYPGAHRLGAVWHGLVACGPRPIAEGASDRTVHFYPGAWGEYEWECVELSMRWMYEAYGVHPYPANGDEIADNYSSSDGGGLTRLANGVPGASPQPGDVLEFAGRSNHTAVVTSSSIDKAGNGSIEVIEQNETADGWGTYAVHSWDVKGVTDWLHKP
ncbi:MAG TPA: CHAP domain-containing protein [Solirubrobacteraceae bacterium]|nr:CHAP domain-containing protein [Solirubrobacteraceae bacterium]